MHFDSHQGGWGYRQKQDLEHEWKRLLQMTVTMCKEGLRTAKPALCLTSLGAGFHQLQDFYAHSNWVEPRFGTLPGYDGPGWAGQGRGITPTWFDLPVAVRDPAKLARVHQRQRQADRLQGSPLEPRARPLEVGQQQAARYADEQGLARPSALPRGIHGLVLRDAAMGRGSPARRRQRAVLEPGQVVADRSRQRSATSSRATCGRAPAQSRTGPATGRARVSRRAARRPGPAAASTTSSSRRATTSPRGRSSFRSEFERVVRLLAVKSDNPPTYVVPSTRQMQELTRFVVVKVLRMKGRGAGDIPCSTKRTSMPRASSPDSTTSRRSSTATTGTRSSGPTTPSRSSRP